MSSVKIVEHKKIHIFLCAKHVMKMHPHPCKRPCSMKIVPLLFYKLVEATIRLIF